jgi:hypothetical protein
MREFLGAILIALALIANPAASRADCYDVFGCSDRDRFRLADLTSGPNCEFLYTMRNSIYAQHHYCFHTPRAIATFGNAGCIYDNVDRVPLNAIERGNAAMILRAEQSLQCPE